MKYRVLAAMAVMVLAVPAMAEEVTLKVAHFLPSAAPTQQRILQPWCEALAKDSQGRIGCQFFPSLQLGGTAAQLVDQVKNGIADVVWTAPGYSPGRFPAIEAFELPFMVTDSVKGSAALWAFYQKYDSAEFADYKVLAFHVDGGQAIHTSSKEVGSLASLAGVKLRASTRLGAKTLTALGGFPVAMPPAQVTDAISKGVVDGAMGAWELVYPTKLSEVTPLHAQPEPGQAFPTATVLMVLMNKKKYDGLPADLKAIIDAHSGAPLVATFGATFDDEAAKTRKRVIEDGAKIINISATELAAMKKAALPVEEEWVKQVTERGLDGKALATGARELAGTR